MKALKFDLCGKYGFFKNNESNAVNMTYQVIPKPTIMGLLGAIIGLDGWNQISEHDGKLEYYEVFKNSKIAITPHKPYFEVFYETINNSTGFENKDGGVANIKRQILQNPCYRIIIQQEGVDKEHYNKLKEMLTKGESIYRICLGNRRYVANIYNFKEIEIHQENSKDDLIINSIIKKDEVEELYEDFEDGVEGFESITQYPTKYDEEYGHYRENIIYTNSYIKVKEGCELYKYNGNIYSFI